MAWTIGARHMGPARLARFKLTYHHTMKLHTERHCEQSISSHAQQARQSMHGASNKARQARHGWHGMGGRARLARHGTCSWHGWHDKSRHGFLLLEQQGTDWHVATLL